MNKEAKDSMSIFNEVFCKQILNINESFSYFEFYFKTAELIQQLQKESDLEKEQRVTFDPAECDIFESKFKFYTS